VIILALDPAEYKIGWAVGESGALPKVGLFKLRTKDERTEDAIERFAKWLEDMLAEHAVQLLTVEQYLPSGALKGHTTSDTRDGAIMLNAAARTVAALTGVPFRSIPPATIRVHFIGKASMGDRTATKAAVIRQAKLLGYVDRNCTEDNICDACALFDFASSHFANRATAFQLA
jgi:Holliday junction resolvasome RuvABC endonuclease subunit